MILDIDGKITSPNTDNLIGKSLAYTNIFLDTLVVQVTGNCSMMHQLHQLTKWMDQILRNGKTTG